MAGEMKGTGLVSVELDVRSGSALEEEYLGSGISHLVEHMLFKGTATRPAGRIEKEVKSYGAFINGSASFDVSSYHVTTPPEHLPKILELLKDMAENASFPEDELRREKEVIAGEIRLNRDDPAKEARRLLWETSYATHPYRYPVIGYSDLLGGLTKDDLKRYYERMYIPRRMVLAIVGDVDQRVALDLAAQVFGDFKRGGCPTTPCSREPSQLSPRYLERPFPAGLTYHAFGFHSTSVAHRDMYAMDVLSMILGQGNNSRLNDVLLKKERIVYAVSAYNYTPRDPGLFIINAVSSAETSDRVRPAVMKEIGILKDELVSDQELIRAKREVLMGYLSSRQTGQEIAQDIAGNEILTGAYDFSSCYVSAVEGITKEDVRDAARAYLTEENLTQVMLSPHEGRPEGVPPGRFAPASASLARPFLKETLPNGLRVIVREDRRLPVVSVTAACAGGVRVENKRTNGISQLVSRLLLRGTAGRSEKDIVGAVEARGGSLEAFSGLNSFGVTLRCFREDLDTCLGILREILADSVFPEDQIEKERALALAQIRDEDDDVFQRGFLAMRKALYGEGPYAMRAAGEPGSVGKLQRDDLVRFYGTWCVPGNIVLGISGDVDTAETVRKVAAVFGGMQPALPPAVAPSAVNTAPGKVEIAMDKEQALIVLGYRSVTARDPDRYAFEVLSSILSGANGRMYARLRDRLGLAYALGVAQAFGIDPGYCAFYLATSKDMIATARRELFAEIKELESKGVTDEEIDLAKRELITAHRSKLQSSDAMSFQAALDEISGPGYDASLRYEGSIGAVGRTDIARIIGKYLDPARRAEVTVSPE